MAKPSPFPVVPGKSWYTLREKAKSSPNTKLNSANVASILGLPEASAQTNVLRGLRALGVIDDQGILSPAGEKWRVDSSYEEACAEILEASYPEDLRLLIGKSAADGRDAVQGWFARKGFGDSSARQMAATFQLVAHPSLELPKVASNGSPTKAPLPRPAAKRAPEKAAAVAPVVAPSAHQSVHGGNDAPKVHLDIQIHIPASATAEQIDLIFSSMAKHLYGR